MNPETKRRLQKRLYQSIENGDTKKVQELIGKGASIHAESDWPIRLACQIGKLETVELLINCGSHINCGALENASMYGHLNLVEFLVGRGAKVDKRNTCHSFTAAAERGHVKIVEFFLNMGVPASNNNGEAMIMATQKGHADVVDLLTQHGCPPMYELVSGPRPGTKP